MEILEFFSGIGGMYYGVAGTSIQFQIKQSFDINPNANECYNYNAKLQELNNNTTTKHRLVNNKSIDSLKVSDLEQYKANTWLMSPPCQPFTRVGLQKDLEDNRTNSFVNLLSILTKLESPPTWILIENVFGFEKSNARELLMEVFDKMNYHYQEFHLSPTQFGIPNQRLRYFCIAKLNSNGVKQELNNYTILKEIPNYIHQNVHSNQGNNEFTISNYLDSLEVTSKPEYFEKYKIQDKTLLSKGMLFDIKNINDITTNCFTKAYFKFVEGTGSVLQTSDPSIKADANDIKSLIPMNLRYFSPKEITRLHAFPESFQFPPTFTPQQCYRLIGNSLNVKIVSELLNHLYYHFEQPTIISVVNNNNNNNSNNG